MGKEDGRTCGVAAQQTLVEEAVSFCLLCEGGSEAACSVWVADDSMECDGHHSDHRQVWCSLVLIQWGSLGMTHGSHEEGEDRVAWGEGGESWRGQGREDPGHEKDSHIHSL